MSKNGEQEYKIVAKIVQLLGFRANSIAIKIHRFFTFPYLVAMMFLTLFQLKSIHNLIEGVKILEAALSYFHGIFRKFYLVYDNEGLNAILAQRQHFWPFDKCGRKLGNYFRWQLQFTFRAEVALLICIFITASFVALQPFFIDGQNLPFEMWTPYRDNQWRIVVVYISEVTYFIELHFHCGCFDLPFFLLCVETSIQFKMLSEIVKTIKLGDDCTRENEEKCWSLLKNCCAYHCWLLNLYQQINNYFGVFFVFQYLDTVLSVCVELVLINEKGASINDLIKCSTYILALFFQLCYFVVPPSMVEGAAEEFANEIYNIDWYNAPSNNFRRDILFMLMKAQDPVTMDGKGLFAITRNVIIQIFKLGFSLSTMLKHSNLY